MPRDDGRVTAVIPVKDPNPRRLAQTLDRLNQQTVPVKEAIVVDSSERPVDVYVDGMPTWVMHAPNAGIAEAREMGMSAVGTEYVVEMDEDAAFLSDKYLERAIEELQDEDVSAAGGVVFPARGNTYGKMIAFADRFNPSDLGTHYLVYPANRKLDSELYPMDHRGEDLTVRSELRREGRIERMTDQAALKDLPTTRQKGLRDTVVTAIVGAVAGAAVSAAEAAIREELQDYSPNA